MRSVPILALLAVLALPSVQAQQRGQTLLFMTDDAWRQSTRDEKLALAADFMRVFCIEPTMSPASLVACLDARGGHDVYRRVLTCSKDLARPS